MNPTLGTQTPGRDLKVPAVILGAAMLAGLLVLAVQLYRLQVVRHDEYEARSIENYVKEVRIRADRGQIKDRTGAVLVENRPSFDVFVTPAFCKNCFRDVLPVLGDLLEWDEENRARVKALVKNIKRGAEFQPIAVQIDLNRDQVDRLSLNRLELPGVDVQAVPHRNYRTGTVLSHVLGYMNEITHSELEKGGLVKKYLPGDYVGRRGIERFYEKHLRGTDGKRKEVVDARGKVLDRLGELLGEDSEVQPTRGANVILSLDMRLQEAAEQAFPGVTGAVVAVDVKTGFILALVSRPGFDPNLLTGRVTNAQMDALAKDPLKPMMNRVAAMHYSPGSIFKPISQIAAFRSGQFHGHTAVNCPGRYRLGSRAWRCHKDSGHGVLDARHAMQKSCDVWFYKAADAIGINPIAATARDFGLGSPTGIGVMSEVPGLVPDEKWHEKSEGYYSKGQALNTVIGQGALNVTPLQMVMAYAALANGGNLHQPQIVQRLETWEGEVLQEFEPKVRRKIEIDPQHFKVVDEGMDMVVNVPGGTAYRARLKNVRVAGKTGTAQVARLGAVRLKTHQMDYWQRDHAWFAAFAPAVNPEIAVVVLNEHGGHGGSDAAPTGMALLERFFQIKLEDAANAPLKAPVEASRGGAETRAVPGPGSLTSPHVQGRAAVAAPGGGR